jgi:hypothetical protein
MALLTPEYLQTKTYAASKDRYAWATSALQAGVYAATDFLVVQHTGTANMTVDIGAGAAWVAGTSVARQGLYHIVNDAAVLSAVTLNASNVTNPRLDKIYVVIHDSTDAGSSDDIPVFGVATGTPVGGTTLDNGNTNGSAAALPANALLLADVLVPASSTTVTTANIRDRRAWARGANWSTIRNNAGGDYIVTVTTMTALDTTNLRARIECTGNPIKLTLTGAAAAPSTGQGALGFMVDGTVYASGEGAPHALNLGNSALSVPFGFSDVVIPAAGSHVFDAAAASGAGTGFRVYAQAGILLRFAVEEIVRQNANNN